MKKFLSVFVSLVIAVYAIQICISAKKPNTTKIIAASTAKTATVSTAKSTTASSILYPIRVNDKYGYIDIAGKIKIKPRFQEAFAFSEGLACVKINGLFGYINNKGKIVIPTKYYLDTRFSDVTRNFKDGLVAINPSLNDNMVFINSKGAIVVNSKAKDYAYGFYGTFSNELAPIAVEDTNTGDQLLGYINKKGAVVIPPSYLINSDNFRFYEFSENLSRVQTRSGWGFINKNGTFSIPAKYEDAKEFSDDLAPVKIRGKWGFINKSDKLVISAQYDNVRPFSDGLAVVALGNKIGYVDKTGKLVISPKFIYDQDIFNEETEAISLGNRGYTCKAGTNDFSDGLASVNINGMWGYINKKGTIVIKPNFDNANAFSNGIASVTVDGKTGYINKKGKFIWNPSK